MRVITPIAMGALALAFASASFATPPPPPNNGFLGIYGDASGTQCCVSVGSFQQATLHLIATTAGATSNGISGAEFRIEISNPTNYIFSYTAPSGSTAIGSPIDDTPSNTTDAKGMNLAFSSCHPSATPMAGDRIDLGTIMVFNLGGGATDLLVKRKNPPSNPDYKAPLFTICDAPSYTKVTMTLAEGNPDLYGSEPVAFVASINKPGCSNGSCGFVAVSQKTWSSIKAFYR